MPQSQSKKKSKSGRVTPKKERIESPESQPLPEGTEQFTFDIDIVREIDHRKLSEAEQRATHWEGVARTYKTQLESLKASYTNLRNEFDELIGKGDDDGEEGDSKKKGSGNKSKGGKVRKNG